VSELPKTEGGQNRDERRSAPRRPYKRQLRNFLIDRGLQLRYILTVTIVSAVISASLGYLIWRQAADASNHVMSQMVGLDSDLRSTASGVLSSGDHTLIFTMVIFGCGLVLVLSLALLVMTHKVAGPLYKVSHHFDDLAHGRFRTVRPLRRFDMLQDFHRKFEVTHEALWTRLGDECDVYDKVVAAASGLDGDAKKAVARLEKHAEARRAAIEVES
jgi:hypothetical protein